MKLSGGKRVLMFFHWLFSVLICAAFVLYLVRPEITLNLYQGIVSRFGGIQVTIAAIALLAIYVILTVFEACIIFHRGRRSDRGFITVDSSDTGRVRIAVSAIEQMVRQSVYAIDGIADMKIGIENLDDAIGIKIASTIQNGSHVPTITMNMQRAIRQFVEMNCGVAVRTVSISINSVTNDAEGGKRKKRGKGNGNVPVIAPVVPAPAPEPEPEKPEPEYVPRVEPQEIVRETESRWVPEKPEIPDPAPIRLTLDPPASMNAADTEAEADIAADIPEREEAAGNNEYASDDADKETPDGELPDEYGEME